MNVRSCYVALSRHPSDTVVCVIQRSACLLAILGCGHKDIDRDKAAALFTEVTVDTAPGLSGLSGDEDGGVWTVSERDARAYLIALDDQLRPTIETFPIEGIPPGTDLEGIAWVGKGKLAFGTEGQHDGVATVLLAEERGPKIEIVGTIALPEQRLGLVVHANHGTEGICGAGTTILAAIEEVGEQGGKRWAPIVQIERGQIAQVHKLWLTTGTGKLSGLDCHVGADGSIQALAIERHFEVTRFLTFTLPAAVDADITPHVALDLAAVLHGKLNLEGIVWESSGRVIAVVDNQYKTITGPSELLVFKPGVVQ